MLNLCLGLKNKRDIVKELMLTENVDVFCLQETELESNFDENLMQIPGYTLEVENNQNNIITFFELKFVY